MKKIEKQVKEIGTLVNMNQAVRLITNLGGVVIGVGDMTVDFIEGNSARSIRFVERTDHHGIKGGHTHDSQIYQEHGHAPHHPHP